MKRISWVLWIFGVAIVFIGCGAQSEPDSKYDAKAFQQEMKSKYLAVHPKIQELLPGQTFRLVFGKNGNILQVFDPDIAAKTQATSQELGQRLAQILFREFDLAEVHTDFCTASEEAKSPEQVQEVWRFTYHNP